MKDFASYLLFFTLFLLNNNSILGQESPITDISFDKRNVYFYISNNSDNYIKFFDKNLEYIKLKKSHVDCLLDQNRLKIINDTLQLDLTNRLDVKDSLNKRVIRLIQYKRWVPDYIEPHQYNFYRVHLKRKYLKKVEVLCFIIQLDDKTIIKYVEKDENKYIRPGKGRML